MTQLTTTNKSPTRFSQAVVSYRKTLQLNNKNNYFKNKLNPLFAGNINECEQKFKKKFFLQTQQEINTNTTFNLWITY